MPQSANYLKKLLASDKFPADKQGDLPEIILQIFLQTLLEALKHSHSLLDFKNRAFDLPYDGMRLWTLIFSGEEQKILQLKAQNKEFNQKEILELFGSSHQKAREKNFFTLWRSHLRKGENVFGGWQALMDQCNQIQLFFPLSDDEVTQMLEQGIEDSDTISDSKESMICKKNYHRISKIYHPDFLKFEGIESEDLQTYFQEIGQRNSQLINRIYQNYL